MMKAGEQSPFISTEIVGLPIGVRGLVHVMGRNDMATGQKLGVHWVAKDPNGAVVEDYEDWEFGDTDPGQTHEFIGDRFDINKAGTWTITIGLFMSPDSPVEVDSYSGVLAVVEQLVGTIVKKELEYDETRGPIPVL